MPGYVSDSPPELPTAERNRRLLQGALRYASLAVTIGAARAEAGETLEEAWQSLSGGGGTQEDSEEPEEGEEWTSSPSRT
jgi:hypothetical protein